MPSPTKLAAITALAIADLLSDEQNAEEAAELKKKRAFRKFSYRGIDLEQYVYRENFFRSIVGSGDSRTRTVLI